MTFRQMLAIDVSPVLLRVALGLTFGYLAMWGFQQGEFSGSHAASLANAGVITPTQQPQMPVVEDVPPMTPDEDLLQSGADEPAEPVDSGTPVETAATTTEEVVPAGATADGAPADGEPADVALPGQEESTSVPDESPAEAAQGAPVNTQLYSAADFPDAVSARRLHTVTAVLYEGARAGDAQRRHLPVWIGQGRAPVFSAYAVAGIAALGSVLLLLGFLTRLASLALMVVMAGSIWVLEISPVVFGDAPGQFGFLPAHNTFSLEAWSSLLWQIVLLAGVFSVFCSGAGMLSLDRFLMGSGSSRQPKSKRAMPPLEAEPEPKRPL